MTASKMHLIILNWLVVNSPRAMEQRIIPELYRGIDGYFQISQNRMGYDEIECNSNKDRERLLLTVKASPFILN
jgi:hypothetical protein